MTRMGRTMCTVAAAVFIIVNLECITPHVRYRARNESVRAARAVFTNPPETGHADSATCALPGLEKIARGYIGTPYRRGGTGKRGMDCSGFVHTVFLRYDGTTLPRTTRMLKRYGKRIRPDRVRCGDLIFFRGGMFNRINHVGIYIDYGRFIHASTRKGVTWDNLDDPYYKKRFAFYRRVR